MSLEVMTTGIILASLTFYVLLGGADYGAGVWKLLARGSHGAAQRRLIEEAIGPIWEANHVWLILVITVLFTAFPAAFAVITTRLHIPLTLMLIGIVLRGAGFAFRGHDVPKHVMRPYWERTFAIASVITPVLLGVTIGAGTICLSGRRVSYPRGEGNRASGALSPARPRGRPDGRALGRRRWCSISPRRPADLERINSKCLGVIPIVRYSRCGSGGDPRFMESPISSGANLRGG